ncbi:MAG: hypothetical protein V1655_03990, partial [bacterium]
DASGLASWQDLAGLPAGTSGQTLRHNGSAWIGNSVLYNDGTNIGIGTATPGAKLEIAGQVKITGGNFGAGKVLTSDASGLASWEAPANVAEADGIIGNEVIGTPTGNATLTTGGVGTSGSPYTLALNLGNANTWTALQTFSNGLTVNGTTGAILKIEAVGLGNHSYLNMKAEAASGWNIINFGDESDVDVGRIGYYHPGDYMIFKTNDAERVRIDNSGNVGIGTITPGAKLDVAGDAKINGLTIGKGIGLNNTIIGEYAFASNTVGSLNTIIGRNALGANTTGDSNVAIGDFAGNNRNDTGAPNVNSNQSVFLGQSANPMTENGTNEIVIGYQAIGKGSNSVVLGNDSITKTILNGSVGIGTTAPSFKLDVNGTLRAASFYIDNQIIGPVISQNGTDIIIGDTASGDGMRGLKFNAGNGPRLYIDNGGNVGIGTITPGDKLEVSGNIKTDGIKFSDGTYQTTANGVKIGTGSALANNLFVVRCGSQGKVLITASFNFGAIYGDENSVMSASIKDDLGNVVSYRDGYVMEWDGRLSGDEINISHLSGHNLPNEYINFTAWVADEDVNNLIGTVKIWYVGT